MKYNFDQTISRTNTRCTKWDSLKDKFGKDDVIPMWIADMDFTCADPILEALKERTNHNAMGYVSAPIEMFSAIAGWVKKRDNWSISDWHFNFVPGVVPGVNSAIQEFTSVGDYVLIQRPVYYPFTNCITNNDRKILNCPFVIQGDSFKLDLVAFEKAVVENKPKLFILCSPHNPVGKLFTKAELEAMGNICTDNNVMIVADEIHCDIIFDNKKFVHLADISERIAMNTITFMAPSKTFNIAGLKASVAVCKNEELSKRLEERFAKNQIGGANVLAIPGFVAAYTKCEDYADQLIAYLQENRNYLKSRLEKEMPKIKMIALEATYLPFVDCRGLNMTNEQLEDFFLNKAKVAPDFGDWFGAEGTGFVRLNLGCPKSVLKEAIDQLAAAYNTL